MVRNRRKDDDGCCSVNFLKYVLFIFNFIFYLAGLTVLGVGIWTLFFKSQYVVLLATKTYAATTYIMIGAGLMVLCVGVIGCIGVTKMNRCCLLAFTFLLLIIFLLEAVAGILAYVYSEQIERELKQSFKQTLTTKYGVDKSITQAADLLHQNHGCCGASSFTDWKESVWWNQTNTDENKNRRLNESYNKYGQLKAPDVCCRTVTPYCGYRDHPSMIYYDGCVFALKQDIQEHEIIIGAIGLGISTVQIFGMVISCCLYIKLKDYEYTKEGKKRPGNSYY